MDNPLVESIELPTCLNPELTDAVTDTASPIFNVPSPETMRQSRWGRKLKPPAVY